MRRAFLLVLALLAALGTAAPSPRAQDSLQIIAVVNDEAISKLDLLVRLQLVMHATGLKDSPEVRARLAPQILRALIDEKLKRAEAFRLGVKASRAEVEQALTRIAQQNGMTTDQFEAAMPKDHELPPRINE